MTVRITSPAVEEILDSTSQLQRPQSTPRDSRYDNWTTFCSSPQADPTYTHTRICTRLTRALLFSLHFQESLQPLTEWIDEEKVEEFNEFLDNQLQEKLGRGFNSAAGSSPSRLSKCAVLVLASSVMVAAIISSLSI